MAMNRCLKSIALVALVCAATIGEAAGAAHIVPNQYAVAVLDQGGDTNDVEGAIYIEALEAGGSSIKGIVSGLAPGLHGFHIHGSADFSDGCSSTGGHWNPDGTNHGAPDNADADKHLGDLGNIEADETGVAYVDITIANDLMDALFSAEDAAPRAFVVHEGEDDLGLGGVDGSLTTGAAGGRLKCGEIKPFVPMAAIATMQNGPEETASITGNIMMAQEAPGLLTVKLDMSGLPVGGKHGLHIHAMASSDPISCGADITGGHFNPLGRDHSGPESFILERHAGDFGNIEPAADGTSTDTIEVSDVYLWGPYSVVGKSWVLHEGTDDLGLGGDDGSLATGNAGGRIKCGTIVTPEVVVTPASTPADPTADGGADDSAAARASSIAWAAIIGAVSVLATMIL